MVPRVFSVVARVLYEITKCKGYIKWSVSLNLTITVENDRTRLGRQTEDWTKFIEGYCIFQ